MAYTSKFDQAEVDKLLAKIVTRITQTQIAIALGNGLPNRVFNYSIRAT
jgi:hypothetical protein